MIRKAVRKTGCAAIMLVCGLFVLPTVNYAEKIDLKDVSSLRSLSPSGFLADGSEFRTWEPASFTFTKTYYVNQKHPKASDSNPGTSDLPFETISKAARILQPAERVVVKEGVYREWVCPVRGGSDPEHIISYEAAPGETVVIKGSEILQSKWTESLPWVRDPELKSAPALNRKIWMARLPRQLFIGYNPFGLTNYPQIDEITYWDVSEKFKDKRSLLYLQVRGLLFQDGRRVKQISRYSDLFEEEGSFWVENHGLTIHGVPYGDINPNEVQWEATTREQAFAPEEYYLGYIRFKGFTVENIGNGFPFPHRGAVSTMHGHHWIIEENAIRWVNGVAVDLGSQAQTGTYGIHARDREFAGYHRVRRNTFEDIGICGVAGPGLENTLIEENTFRRNCWHDVETLAECAAIKTHINKSVLMRRNIIVDTLYGTGIYIDCHNANTRICQNVIVNTGSEHGDGGIGGIYIEASEKPNMVDNNFIWNSTRRNGIYCFFVSNVTIAHNMIGNCAQAGIMLLDVPERPEGNPGGSNRVFNNIFVNNKWCIDFHSGNNKSDYNLFDETANYPNAFRVKEKKQNLDLANWRQAYGFGSHSAIAQMRAEFNPETLELVWSAEGPLPACLPIDGVCQDFWANPHIGWPVVPGPFGEIPEQSTPIVVDPRRAKN